MKTKINGPVVRIFGLACAIGGATILMQVSRAQQQPVHPATQPVSEKDAVALLIEDVKSRHRALSAARSDLVLVSLVLPVDDAAIAAKVNAVTDAERSLANVLAQATAAHQQSAAIKANADRGRRIPNIPDLTSAQCDALTQMTGLLQPPALALTRARGAVLKAALAEPPDDAAIRTAADAVAAAEASLARARADAFAKLQASPNKLAANQVAVFISMGGMLQLGSFYEPKPYNFEDHEGYTSLFDGVSLKGWDGNPKIWRVENGQIIGESTPENPSGNTYLVYRDQQAKDFTLKFEIKIDGNGGSGMQYRSRTGIPWLAPVAEELQPVNLSWMMTGPQADFWPSQIYSGQFYSENTPMRIIAWRGQVVETAGLGPKRLMGTIGDRKALGSFEHKNDWNQYTVIARSGTFIHIMNGQLMSVLVDDDPTSSNNQTGFIGIEIESITKLYVRNVWLKKLN
jgi:hypothetical protein